MCSNVSSCECQFLLTSFEEIVRKESFHIYRSVAYLLTADLLAHKWEQKGGQGTERWGGEMATCHAAAGLTGQHSPGAGTPGDITEILSSSSSDPWCFLSIPRVTSPASRSDWRHERGMSHMWHSPIPEDNDIKHPLLRQALAHKKATTLQLLFFLSRQQEKSG